MNRTTIGATTLGLVAMVVLSSTAFAQEPEPPQRPVPPTAPPAPSEPNNTPAADTEPASSPPTDAPSTVQPETLTLRPLKPLEHDDDTAQGITEGGEAGPHLRYELEGIDIRGNTRTSDRVVRRYIKLHPGDILDLDNPEIELMRFRLLGTGYFRTVELSLRKGTRRGRVILVVSVLERNTIVVSDIWMALSADADTAGNARPLAAYAGADIAETNLAGTGITLAGAVGLAPGQLALRARYFDPAFVGTHWMTSAGLLYNNARDFFGTREVLYDDPNNATERVEDYAVVQYRRFGGWIGVGHDLSVPVQAWLDYRLERLDSTPPLAASHRRGLDIEPIDFGLNPGLSVLSTLRGTIVLDTRDSPILPTRGWHTTLSAEVSLSPLGSSYAYEKISLNASRWWQLPWGHVIRLQAFGGAIAGYAPIYERYYVGDFSDFLPDRMLDLNTDRRPAPNFLNTSIVEVRYGHYAAKLVGEYRVPLYRGRRSVYGIDLFTAAGFYGLATQRDLNDPPRGYNGLRRIPVDLTFNLGIRIDTSVGGFAFALSNIVGFIPVRGEARP